MGLESVLDKVVCCLADVPGVSAIVLGGSRATATAGEGSDVDIGIYYHPGVFDPRAMQEAAAKLDDQHREFCATLPGEWGRWINGGGWLTVEGMQVDILYRDLSAVECTVSACLQGEITMDYQCGHPFGFVNAIYLGEVDACRILYQRDTALSQLKEKLTPYPVNFRKALVEKMLWECSFSLTCGQKSIGKQDLFYGVGSLFRCAGCLIQALYGIHRKYCLNEKGSLRRLETMGVSLPEDFSNRLENALAVEKSTLASSFQKMETLYREVEELWKKTA
jgi:hypothetical protein